MNKEFVLFNLFYFRFNSFLLQDLVHIDRRSDWCQSGCGFMQRGACVSSFSSNKFLADTFARLFSFQFQFSDCFYCLNLLLIWHRLKVVLFCAFSPDFSLVSIGTTTRRRQIKANVENDFFVLLFCAHSCPSNRLLTRCGNTIINVCARDARTNTRSTKWNHRWGRELDHCQKDAVE